ncbi:distal tail protein Dit, partial [Lacticaseibacillus paracasei]|uniref:distal tail protein Dit n=1 Tax=Lacticaseibacillus paracasei TaxID=1597 RepID=UPI000A7EE1C6
MKKVITVTFGDVDLSPYFIVSNITMPFLYKDNKYDQVGLSDGEQLTYSRNAKTPITIEGTILSENSDLTVAETRDQLISLLSGNVTKQLKLSNYPGRYFDAIFEGTQEYDGTFDYIAKVDLVFMVPDGIAHSIATQTADNMPYKDVPVNMLTGKTAVKTGIIKAGSQGISGYSQDTVSIVGGETYTYSVSMIAMGYMGHSSIAWLDANKKLISTQGGKNYPWTADGGRFSNTFTAPGNAFYANLTPWFFSQAYTSDTNISWSQEKFELGTTASPWSPNPADPEYYTNTITVHNGGTYPVEPVITATMHADNGFLGFANSQGGVLQFGNPEEVDGYTSEESEVALNLAAVQGSHMDNQAASNNLYWGDNPATPNEQIGNAIWTQDSYDG